MGLRNGKPLTIRPIGLSDATDGTNAFAGAMAQLQNLIPNPKTAGQFVCRPASGQITNFSGFTTPAQGTALLVVGTRAYGFIASARFAGKDEPFVYDLVNNVFVTLANVVSANCPTTQPTTGDWTPPSLAMIGNRLAMTHPGYDGITHFVGWIDFRSFTSNTLTGNSHSNTTIDTLSASPILSGWQVGDAISESHGDIPAGTYITALTATSVTLSQAATGTHAGGTYTVTSGTAASPTYGSGQMNANPFPSVPNAVAQFNNRAYYAVGNGVQASDALNAQQQTNANQQATLGDNTNVTALSGLPLGSQVAGGIIQSLIAFKGAGIMYQITGDPALANLSISAINGSVGTKAPNTISATPKGLAYIAPDGLRIIDINAQVGDPIGANGEGVANPFIKAVNPSRMAAAYNQDVYRVSVQNGDVNGQPMQDYWYHMKLGVWTGPHTFPASLIEAYTAPGENTFVMFASGINAALWQSDVVQLGEDTYTENGTALTWAYQPSLLPDNSEMEMNTVIETAIGLSLPAAGSVNALCMDEAGNPLGNAVISVGGNTGAIWGAFNWGAGVWGGQQLPFKQYPVEWPNELTFKQASMLYTGQSAAGVAVGNLYVRYQILGYLLTA